MILTDKIKNLYQQLEGKTLFEQGIIIQNDSDGKGDYIAKWEHPTLPKPTQEQLDGMQ